jgi:hypothetical protein
MRRSKALLKHDQPRVPDGAGNPNRSVSEGRNDNGVAGLKVDILRDNRLTGYHVFHDARRLAVSDKYRSCHVRFRKGPPGGGDERKQGSELPNVIRPRCLYGTDYGHNAGDAPNLDHGHDGVHHILTELITQLISQFCDGAAGGRHFAEERKNDQSVGSDMYLPGELWFPLNADGEYIIRAEHHPSGVCSACLTFLSPKGLISLR